MTSGHTVASPVLHTTRLRLRVVEEQDAPITARLMTPGISQWLASWPSPSDEAGAAARLRRLRDATLHGQALCLALEPREGGGLMGMVIVVRAKYNARRGDLGYWLGEPFHRRGYMSEAAAAAVSDAFARLGLDAIEAGARRENAASLALMRRLGMRPIDERQVWAESRGREEWCAYYEITRAEHAASHA